MMAFSKSYWSALGPLSLEVRAGLANDLTGAMNALHAAGDMESARHVAEFIEFLRAPGEEYSAVRRTALEMLTAGRVMELEDRLAKAEASMARWDETMPWHLMLYAEVLRGRAKFPRSRFMLFALLEEVGELAEALIRGDTEDAKVEAVQVAAVAVRISEEGDATAYESSLAASCALWLGEYVRRAIQKPADMHEPFARSAAISLRKRAEKLYDAGDRVIATVDADARKP